MLKALAKLAFELCYGHVNIKDEDGYKKLLHSIRSQELDFSHENPIWLALFKKNNDERAKQYPGIEKYLYIPEETNLDAGVFDETNNWVRFGNRHNDIYPRLGDIIRWKINLSPRPSVQKALDERND